MFHDDFKAATLVADRARLESVRSTRLAGSVAEEVFDRITRLAAKLTKAPVSFFSVVEADHDYFKSIAADDPQLATIRRVEGRSFCHYSMLGEGPLVVEDARIDAQLAQLPSVTALGIVACLGVPLRLPDGQPLGAFCVVDVKPRAWTQQDIEVITELGEAAIREVRLRMLMQEVERTNAARNELLSLIASDLRNPVTVVSLSADLLQEGDLGDAQNELVARIKHAAERMEDSIQHALQVAKETPQR